MAKNYTLEDVSKMLHEAQLEAQKEFEHWNKSELPKLIRGLFVEKEIEKLKELNNDCLLHLNEFLAKNPIFETLTPDNVNNEILNLVNMSDNFIPFKPCKVITCNEENTNFERCKKLYLLNTYYSLLLDYSKDRINELAGGEPKIEPLENPIDLNTIPGRVMLFEYLGLIDFLTEKYEITFQSTTMSKTLGYLMQENPDSIRPYLSSLRVFQKGKNNPKNSKSLTQVIKTLEDLKLKPDLVPKVQNDLKKITSE